MIKPLLVLFLLSSLACYSQGNKIDFEEYDLDNGLHVILHQDNTTPIVTVSVLYHVGSKNELKGRSGFAHFFEHLMFEGSENIARGQYMKTIEAAGGTLNANTSNDRTFYYQTLPSNQLELGLYMESERMLHAKIDSAGIATQKEVVKEEKRMRVDNRPYGSFQQKMFFNAFEGTSYEWTPIGSFEDIDAATDQDFEDFYKLFYVPNNATLSIAGDIDKEEAKVLISKYFSEIKTGKRDIQRPDITPPVYEDEVRVTVYDNVQLSLSIYGYRVPAQGTDEYYALQMLTTVLADGQSSRMYKELVDKQQIAANAFSFLWNLESAGIFMIGGYANLENTPDEIEAAIEEQIDKISNELITDREHQKLKNQMENAFVRGNSTVQGIAESLANYHVYFKNSDLINSEIERYMAVTKEDIINVAKKYLKKDNRVVLTYLPKSAQQEPGAPE